MKRWKRKEINSTKTETSICFPIFLIIVPLYHAFMCSWQHIHAYEFTIETVIVNGLLKVMFDYN